MFQISTLLSYCCFWISSGEEYKGVPQTVSLKSGEFTDQPKSHIFTIFYFKFILLHEKVYFKVLGRDEECRYRACTTLHSRLAWWFLECAIIQTFPQFLSFGRDFLSNKAPWVNKGRFILQKLHIIAQCWDDLDNFGSWSREYAESKSLDRS